LASEWLASGGGNAAVTIHGERAPDPNLELSGNDQVQD